MCGWSVVLSSCRPGVDARLAALEGAARARDAVLGRHVGEPQQRLIARMHCREDPIVSNSDLIGWCTHDVRERLPDVSVPVTFVAGEDDLWVDATAVARSASLVPDGRFVLLDGVGHYPMEEMSDFVQHLDRWIGDMLAPATGRRT